MEQALQTIPQLQQVNKPRKTTPNINCSTTLMAALKRCSRAKDLARGKQLHKQAIDTGQISNLFVANSLITMYSKCGCIPGSIEVFNAIPEPDIVSWNALLQAHLLNSSPDAALRLFTRVQSPNARTYLAGIMACIMKLTNRDQQAGERTRWLEQAKLLHSQSKLNHQCDVFVDSAMIDLLAKFGSMEEARIVFDGMKRRNGVTWSCLIQGYVENGESDRALELVSEMRSDGDVGHEERNSSAVYAPALAACGNLMNEEKGRELHGEICGCGMEKDVEIATCLMDLYGKCGRMEVAEEVFDSIVGKDLWAWNTLMCGYSQQGDSFRVFDLFRRMREEGMIPDAITFTHILTACSHAGLTERGKEFFFVMMSEYRVSPDLVHYACIVDLLGRANYLEEALSVLRSMPFEPNDVAWHSLLAACQKWKNTDVGQLAYDALMSFNQADAAAHVLLADF